MRKISITLLISFALSALAQAQQITNKAQESAMPAPVASANFIAPTEAGVKIGADVRTMVVMAALNIAGFDYEPGGHPLTPLRAEVRRDLVGIDSALRERIARFYKANMKPGSDEGIEAVRYSVLSLLMTDPPAFRIYEDSEDDEVVRAARIVPADLKPLVDFSQIVSAFYTGSKVKEFLPKYMAVGQTYAQAYRQPVGELIYEVSQYFQLKPEPTVNMRPLVLSADEAPSRDRRQKTTQIARIRSRNVFIIPDPLAAYQTAFVRDDLLNQKEALVYRRVGDDYIVIIGPSRTPSLEAIRRVLIRYMIDPMIERHLRKSLEYKDQISKLVATVPTAQKGYSTSVYLVLRESLAQAAEARLRRIDGLHGRISYTDDDAAYDLSQAYLNGAVLSFHFYEALTGLEKVGISIEDFFDEMLSTTKFDHEATRSTGFAALAARVTEARKARAEKAARDAEANAAVTNAAVNKMLLSDDLIRQRRFKEAGVLLEEVIAVDPNNARALFGLAQVANNQPSAAELDAAADENDKIQQQHDRLEKAIGLYRKAIEKASRESETWLIQWCHVYIGRILDFQDFRLDAIAEYDKAIALGPVENGAYNEAMEGKKRPHGQK